MSNALILLFVLAAGLAQPFQVAMNTKLDQTTHSTTTAAFIAFLGGAVVVAMLWALGVSRGQPAKLVEAPWWAWLTGPVGVAIVCSALIALPRSNAAVVIALIVLGQSTASLAMDHYGWLDVKRVPINAWRVGGTVLILGGTLMMQKR